MVKQLVVAWLVLMPHKAAADAKELVAGVQASLVFPNFSSPTPTDFALAAWSGGAFGLYGLTSRLSVGAAFDIANFRGEAMDQNVSVSGVETRSHLRFSGVFYHTQLLGRLSLLRGHDWAPYLHAGLGYVWASYFDPRAVDSGGRALGARLDNFSQGSMSVSGGVLCDMRFMDFLVVSAGVRYTRVMRGMLGHFIDIPITAAIGW